MRRSPLVFGLALVLILGAAATLQAANTPDGKYFPGAGIDLVQHELEIGIFTIADDGSDGNLLETLQFDGRMLLERGDPYTNADGFRQIDFVVKEWEAFAWSDTLQTMVNYRLTEGLQQKLSSITAQQASSDFPAEFVFSVGFTAHVLGIYLPHPHGRPHEKDFFEVPPSGNRRTSPTLYGFEAERIEFDHPEHGQLRFVPLKCNDSKGETLVSFEKGSPAADPRLARHSR